MAPKNTKPSVALPVAEIKRLKSALSYRSSQPGVSDLAEEYKSASHEGKRKILELFSEQPNLKWAVEYCKSNEHSKVGRDVASSEWITKKALAKREGLDLDREEDMEELQLLLDSMTSRPHEVPALAAKGVLQYQQTTQTSVSEEKHEEKVKVTQSIAGIDKQAKESSAQRRRTQNAIAKGEVGAIDVNWTVALRKLNKECASVIGHTNRLLANARRFQNELSPDQKKYLRDAMKLLEAGSDGLEDCAKVAEPCETDHTRLQELLTNMRTSTSTFTEMLREKLPKALPKTKSKPSEESKTEDAKPSTGS